MFRRLVLISILFISAAGFGQKTFSVTADSAVLMSPLTKRVIYSKNPHQKLPPASTAKIMTTLVVVKNSHPNKRVIVSKRASQAEPSKVHIREGEVYITDDLLKALLLNSGNDASIALAESVAGTEEDFSRMMNALARSIGAKNTNFKNASGLPAKNQYSTAYDMALIVRKAMENRYIADIMRLRETEIKEIKSGRIIKLRNHNKSLWKDTPYSIFGKTGYTVNAQHCFAGYIRYNRWKKVIVVILKSRKPWHDLKTLAKSD